MKRIKILLLSVLILHTSAIFSQENPEMLMLKQFHNITSEEMMTWVEKLCSPEFNGRLTGTPEYLASAEWVAGKLPYLF